MPRSRKTTPVATTPAPVTPAPADPTTPATTPATDDPTVTTTTTTTPDVTPAVTPAVTTTPAVDFAPGAWVHAGSDGPVHKSVTPNIGGYFRAACGPAFKTGPVQTADGDNSTDACHYCATGTLAPPDTDVTPRRTRATADTTPNAPTHRLPGFFSFLRTDALRARETRLVADIATRTEELATTRKALRAAGIGSGRGVSTGARKPATTPAVGNRVNYTDAAGKTVEMSISAAVKAIAVRFPDATRCVKYAADIADKKSLNARLFLDKDLRAKRIPDGVVAYVASAATTPPADPAVTTPDTTPADTTPADTTPVTTPPAAPADTTPTPAPTVTTPRATRRATTPPAAPATPATPAARHIPTPPTPPAVTTPTTKTPVRHGSRRAA